MVYHIAPERVIEAINAAIRGPLTTLAPEKQHTYTALH